MIPQDFKTARRKLGLTLNRMAEAVGVADGRTVRRWEAGDRDIPGPVEKLLQIWLDPRCPDWAKPNGSPHEGDDDDENPADFLAQGRER
ncbi:MAG TPA: hypothetical protein PKZ99_10370 [Azospirillaceae bacterium]|nr:hypothetical protein [Azospirillaceae bacterium]